MSKRVIKVNELVGQVVADAISHEVESSGMVTVKAVETTPDLRHADVWLSILGEDKDEIMHKVEEKRREIQKNVNKTMFSKHVPVLRFKIDYSGEHAQRIEELLRNGCSKN